VSELAGEISRDLGVFQFLERSHRIAQRRQRQPRNRGQSASSRFVAAADFLDAPELYVADTVWSRGTRGTRTDYITVYDTATLKAVGEIVLPTKRGLITAMEGMFAFTDGERMGWYSISRRPLRSRSSI
jgi:hypothetical protein